MKKGRTEVIEKQYINQHLHQRTEYYEALEVTQLWNNTQHQLRANGFQTPLLHKYLYVGTNIKMTEI